MERPQKITFGEMRDIGVRGILICVATETAEQNCSIG
jgi:hypothetical protein